MLAAEGHDTGSEEPTVLDAMASSRAAVGCRPGASGAHSGELQLGADDLPLCGQSRLHRSAWSEHERFRHRQSALSCVPFAAELPQTCSSTSRT